MGGKQSLLRESLLLLLLPCTVLLVGTQTKGHAGNKSERNTPESRGERNGSTRRATAGAGARGARGAAKQKRRLGRTFRLHPSLLREHWRRERQEDCQPRGQ
jgi:hypothetical protein